MPQPSSAAHGNGTSSSTGITDCQGTTISSAQVPQPAMPNAGVPSPSVKRGVLKPSTTKVRQRNGRPRRHSEQLPQAGVQEITTCWPGVTEVTRSPTARTSPAPSCPSTAGIPAGITPLSTDRSEWHTPVARSRTFTSPGTWCHRGHVIAQLHECLWSCSVQNCRSHRPDSPLLVDSSGPDRPPAISSGRLFVQPEGGLRARAHREPHRGQQSAGTSSSWMCRLSSSPTSKTSGTRPAQTALASQASRSTRTRIDWPPSESAPAAARPAGRSRAASGRLAARPAALRSRA